MIAGHHRHEEPEREGPLGTWFRATRPDGSPGGLLRLAEDVGLERVVAVTRTLRELDLPGVLPVTDLVRQHRRVWLVVALPPGPTLADLLAGEAPDLDHALAVLGSTAQALLAMHAAGLVHGAVGTGAVVLGADGTARLADWGVAGTEDDDVLAWAQMARTLAMAGDGELARFTQLALAGGLGAVLDELRAGDGADSLLVTAAELPDSVPRVPDPSELPGGRGGDVGAGSVYETVAEFPGAVPRVPDSSEFRGGGGGDVGAGSVYETVAEFPGAVPRVPDPSEFRGGESSAGSMFETAPELPGSVPPVPAARTAPDDPVAGPGTDPGTDPGAAPAAETQLGARRSNPVDAPPAQDGEVRRFGRGVPDLTPPSRAEAIWRRGATQRPRRGRRLASFALTLVIVGAAIVVGLWLREPGALEITGVQVRTDPRGPGCDGTALVTGLISTNGGRGEIEYRWVRSDGPQPEPPPLLQVSRQPEVQVTLQWPFTGRRTAEYSARLEVLAPQQNGAEQRFVYNCP